MIEFIQNYGYIIWIVLVTIIYTITSWNKAKEMAHNAILNAKRMAKDKVLSTGQEQEDYAVKHFYPLLPARLRLFISETMFRTLIKKLYKKAVDLIDDGKFNNSND